MKQVWQITEIFSRDCGLKLAEPTANAASVHFLVTGFIFRRSP